jgi:hypothetical protein
MIQFCMFTCVSYSIWLNLACITLSPYSWTMVLSQIDFVLSSLFLLAQAYRELACQDKLGTHLVPS